jgi:glycine/D-amino acid oxidase-like deaminating enzyme
MVDALRQLRAMFATVDEMHRVIDVEDIACGFVKGGAVRVARNDAQARRQREEIEHHRNLGLTEDEVRLLDADAARALCNATDVRSGIFLAACASVDPARLVRGPAEACERRGVTDHERIEVTAIKDRRVTTAHGTVRADVAVRATEAYTRDLPDERRR